VKLVAVGDIHADAGKLFDVINKLVLKVDFDKTTFVFLGDYVDGGTSACTVIDALIDYQSSWPHWKFLMGNHEDMMLSALGVQLSLCRDGGIDYSGDYYLWYNQGGRETLDSYYRSSQLSGYERAISQDLDVIPKEHIKWLRGLELTYATDNHIFVHAGLNPKGSSTVYDMLWIRDQFIRSDLDFGKRVIFGHTHIGKQPLVLPNKIGIDTMHHGHGVLSALIIDEEKKEYELVQSYSE
jgi:serine/threonine protein phosphatase 1